MEECFDGSRELLDCKLEVDGIDFAIEQVTEKSESGEFVGDLKVAVEKLVARKKESQARYHALLKEVLEVLDEKNNTVRLKDLWYAVRYLDPKMNERVGVYAIGDSDLVLFQVAPDSNRDLKQSEVELLAPAMEDDATKARYSHMVEGKATGVLLDLGLVDELDGRVIGAIDVSVHACRRWVQRVMNINNENKISRFIKDNPERVREAVLDSYKGSECVWVDVEGIEYWFNEENVVFVVGSAVIITLYEKDFGFSKEINRKIVKEQLEVIERDWDRLEVTEGNYRSNVSQIQLDCTRFDDEIELLESRIEGLRAEQFVSLSRKEVLLKAWNYRKTAFEVEFNKLFSRNKPK